MPSISCSRMNNHSDKIQEIVLLFLTMQASFLELLRLLLIIRQTFQILQSNLLSELYSFLNKRFNIELLRELQMRMDFCIHVPVKIKHNSLEMNKHNIRCLFQQCFLRNIALLITELTHPVIDHLSLTVVLQSFSQIISFLHSYLVIIEGFISLFLLPTIMADHLNHCCSLETAVNQMSVRCIF